MFGIGPMEMGIIAVVALLIFGPEKLPEMMGQAGKMVRDFRKMTSEMSGEFEKTIAEAKGLTKEFQGEVGSMQRQVNSVTSSIQKDLGGGKKSTSKSTTATKRSSTGAKKSGTSSGSSSTRKASASKSASSSTSSTSSTSTSKSTTAPKPVVPQQATREDPTAAISLFEPSAPRREKRTRKATLAAFGEATPRTAVAPEPAPDANGQSDIANSATSKPLDLNDPLARARQRRQSAGYARKIS